jgi:hypothetical protein
VAAEEADIQEEAQEVGILVEVREVGILVEAQEVVVHQEEAGQVVEAVDEMRLVIELVRASPWVRWVSSSIRTGINLTWITKNLPTKNIHQKNYLKDI